MTTVERNFLTTPTSAGLSKDSGFIWLYKLYKTKNNTTTFLTNVINARTVPNRVVYILPNDQ